MRSGKIQNSQLTASSYYVNQGPINARLFFTARNGRTGAWSAKTNDHHQWLQVDFKRRATVVGVSTQGREDCCHQWVKSYVLYYSNNGITFFPRRYHGHVQVCIIYYLVIIVIVIMLATLFSFLESRHSIYIGAAFYCCVFPCADECARKRFKSL